MQCLFVRFPLLRRDPAAGESVGVGKIGVIGLAVPGFEGCVRFLLEEGKDPRVAAHEKHVAAVPAVPVPAVKVGI